MRSGSGSSLSSSGAPCRSTCDNAHFQRSFSSSRKCCGDAQRALTSAFSRSSVIPSARFARWPLQITIVRHRAPDTRRCSVKEETAGTHRVSHIISYSSCLACFRSASSSAMESSAIDFVLLVLFHHLRSLPEGNG
jgi:hypothetical protein